MGLKITYYVMLLTGMSILFYFTGLINNNPLLDLLLNPQNLTASELFFNISVAIATTAGAVIIGFITKDLDKAAMAFFVPYIGILLWNSITVFNVMSSTAYVISVILFGSVIFLFIISLLDYWRGND